MGALALIGGAPVLAVPGGEIATAHRGAWVCELPGDAMGTAGVHQPALDFRIVHGSTYVVRAGRGSYLLTGKLMVMTSGPRKGERWHVISDDFMRRMLPDGSDSDLRCVRGVANNTTAQELNAARALNPARP